MFEVTNPRNGEKVKVIGVASSEEALSFFVQGATARPLERAEEEEIIKEIKEGGMSCTKDMTDMCT